MKLIRFGTPGNEKPGLEVDGIRFDLCHLVDDYNEEFFAGDGIDRLKAEFDPKSAAQVDKSIRLGAPVSRPGKRPRTLSGPKGSAPLGI